MRRRAAVLTLLALAGAALPAAAEPVGDLRIRIEQPDVSSPVADGDGTAFIAGRAVGFLGRSERFDVVIAIDTSRSTAAPAGVDVDRDGTCGVAATGRFSDRMSSDPGDSVLAAQVAAARTLLAQIDPELSRVALV